MKLEEKFFNSFFYTFLISIILSILIVTIFVGLFINNFYSKKTFYDIIKLEKQYSKININSANALLTTAFQKMQASLNEQILSYQRAANNILKSKQNLELNSTYLKSILSMDLFYCFYDDDTGESNNTALWILDNVTTEENLDLKKEAKNQLIAFTKILPNLDSNLRATLPNIYWYSFYFENNELYIIFPLSNLCETFDFINIKTADYSFYLRQCYDENANYNNVYKFRCELYYENFQKSKSNLFDNNYSYGRNKTIFISNYYDPLIELDDKKFHMCIEFDDPITQGKAYSCCKVHDDDLISILEDLNSKIIGYFLITIVGFNNVFFFPQGPVNPKTITENIFNWENKFILDEKKSFYDKIKKIFSSNYIDYIGNSIFDEIYINGKNSSQQFFYKGGEKFSYSIYPVILDNLYGEKEHVFSIIHIYQEQLFLKEINQYNSSLVIKIILEVIIFIIFGLSLLYLIYSTFNIFAKYIVIPIKNVNYMLLGINIGGKERLKYLEFLKNKQEENIDKLENDFLIESKKEINKKTENHFDDAESSNQLDIKFTEKNNILKFSDFDKQFDEESDYIEKENKFYDFDEELLLYRPIEIDSLVTSLLNLKNALVLTSEDRQVNQIIDYSYSENIFKNLKNKEGSIICQSNIGNLESQILQYDKAIYHLVISLQETKLERFLKRNLSDEFDEGDILLKLISNLFNEKTKEKNNKLIEKQINNSREEFSQKTIGILINTRYCRLIYVYFKFFKNMKKINKLSEKAISEQFINTSFHTISYFHKIIIKYIYLSYVKNDLVKIGESILDYIEFLIKFKFKISSDEKDFMKINNKDFLEFNTKQNFKKKIFGKILNWLNLFDNYVYHVKNYSSLNDTKTIIDDYSKNLDSDNINYNEEVQGSLMLKINIQRSEFLKGKFCLYCENYNDALFYFIRAAKRKSFVLDGLIKKRSLKHLLKLLKKMKKGYDDLKIMNLKMEKEMKEINKKNKLFYNKINDKEKGNNIKITFERKIEEIKKEILQDIDECNENKERDILILIDFNIYNYSNKEEDNIVSKIDKFIEQTIIMLNDFFFGHDRIAVFIYQDKCQIICPLTILSSIDINNISKNLLYYKNIKFNEIDETDEFNITYNEQNKIETEFNLGNNNNISDSSEEESSSFCKEKELNINILKNFVDAINYLNKFSSMKDSVKNEKYIIVFSDITNILLTNDENFEKIEKVFEILNNKKEVIFLLVGKFKKSKIKNDKSHKNVQKLILNKFKETSELIDINNMNRIKSVLSNNNVIKEDIIYPNEIYK